jgi:PAS domain S-box-containing protein
MTSDSTTQDPAAVSALRVEIALARDLLDYATDLIHVTDAELRLVYVNRTWCTALGYRAEEVLGRSFLDIVHPDFLPQSVHILAPLTDNPAPSPWVIAAVLAPKAGGQLVVEGTVSARFDAGRLAGTRAYLRDVTARREAEDALVRSRDELRAANAALERASRAKDEFLASMSHELRTPLNAILGLTEAICEGVYGAVEDRQRAALRRVDESGRHLLALITDILDLAKIQADKVELELSPVDLESLVRASLRLVQEAARRKGLRVSSELPFAAPTVLLDERRMKQVLTNLLSNAVKFTPEGGAIGVQVAVGADGETLSFAVWDCGIGIERAHVGRLFQPFVQLDSSLAREHAGTGLGLALVRRIVDLHGGSVGLESEPGKGSRFTVTVPLRAAAGAAGEVRPPSPVCPPPAASRRRVLVAEDDDNNASLVVDVLETSGYEVHVARSGAEAVALARTVRPDVVLMDLQMPVMDGIAATRAIRGDAHAEVRRVPIIALTALAMPGDRELCLGAGADDYLCKPVGARRLVRAIAECLARRGEGSAR